MEFFIVAAALIGWGIMELVGLRLDKRRREEDERAAQSRADSGAASANDNDASNS
jgi:hypothetical protein